MLSTSSRFQQFSLLINTEILLFVLAHQSEDRELVIKDGCEAGSLTCN